MAINKVVYDGNTLIDLTEDDVTPDTLSAGVRAHDASGNVIVGTARGVSVDSAMSDTSTNPVQNKVVKKYIDTEIDKVEKSAEDAYKLASTKQDKLSAAQLEDINDISRIRELAEQPQIKVDNELSDISENPVQNKVVKQYIDKEVKDIQEDVSSLEEDADKLEVRVAANEKAISETLPNEIEDALTEAKGYTDDVKDNVGDVNDLNTADKTVTGAINEVLATVNAGDKAALVTLEKSANGTTYTLKQGGLPVGTIAIPKDMVVESGTVVTNPTGYDAGTYIELTLANAASDKIYINVGTLIDVYTAKANAAQVQIAIDSATREISASIVAGSIDATELAANAVTTVKIANANVTKAKLASDVQSSLGKADSAVQPGDLGTMAKETAADYIKKTEATGYNDILTKTDANTKYYGKTEVDTMHNNLYNSLSGQITNTLKNYSTTSQADAKYIAKGQATLVQIVTWEEDD